MTWNYRILRHTGDHGAWYAVHEVFYNEKEKPTSWTQDPITFVADEDEGAPGVIAAMAKALADCAKRPVLRVVKTKKGKEKLKEVR